MVLEVEAQCIIIKGIHNMNKTKDNQINQQGCSNIYDNTYIFEAENMSK
jgi:hypothetical protein